MLKNIKKDKPFPIVIMFTNYPYPQYRKKCMDAGVDFFFCKLTEFDKLIDALKELVQDFHTHKVNHFKGTQNGR